MSDTVTYNCPNCGANIEGSKEGHSYECPYCNSSFTFEEMQAFTQKQQAKTSENVKRQAQKEVENEQYGEAAIAYECKNCGSQVVSDKKTVATFCLYCHSQNIIQARLVEKYAPDKILPFEVHEEDAKKAFLKWAKGVTFLPDGFTDEKHLAKISAFYAPSWLYYTHGDFAFAGEGIKTKSWMSGNYRYTQKDVYQVRKTGKIQYQEIPVDASSTIDNRIIEMLEPYDYGKAKPFDMTYLAGHYAEKYDDEHDVLYKDVEIEMQQNIARQIQTMKSEFTSFKSAEDASTIVQDKVEYAFYPLWFLNYRYDNKDYVFTMNGQTGKVVGDLPIDSKKQKQYQIKMTLGIFAVIVIVLIVNIISGVVS